MHQLLTCHTPKGELRLSKPQPCIGAGPVHCQSWPEALLHCLLMQVRCCSFYLPCLPVRTSTAHHHAAMYSHGHMQVLNAHICLASEPGTGDACLR